SRSDPDAGGRSRNRHHQTAATTIGTGAVQVNVARQPNRAIAFATTGGGNADPTVAPRITRALENARRDTGAQFATARAATGNIAASPAPRTNRSPISVANADVPDTIPVRKVATPQIAADTVSTMRAP